MTRITRRSFIALSGTVSATTLAGCNGGSSSPDNSTEGNSTNESDGNSTDGSDEPVGPSVEIVSHEDGDTVEASSTVTVEVEVTGFNLVDPSVAPDSVDEQSGYVVTYLDEPSDGPAEELAISSGETIETGSLISPMFDGGTVGNRLVGSDDEYFIFAQLVRADDTATEFYDYVRVTTTE